jgi:hypothetical protein
MGSLALSRRRHAHGVCAYVCERKLADDEGEKIGGCGASVQGEMRFSEWAHEG